MRIVAVLLFICWMGVLPVCAEPEEIDDKGCRDCHRFSAKETRIVKGPDLFYAGDKFLRNWLKEFLQSPSVIRKVVYISGPDYPSEKPEANQSHIILTKEESDRVLAFLMTLRLPDLEKGKVDKQLFSKAMRGKAKMLFERNFGCISCHKTLNLVGKVRGGVSGPSLINSGSRLKPDWIYHWLKTPKKFLSKGRMPIFDLDEETVILITKYILSIRTKS